MTNVTIQPQPIALKGGQWTNDPRLDRVREVDLRSLNYLVGDVLTAEEFHKPRGYTWRLEEWFDQGSEGACFVAGTLIRMADGSHKPIEEIKTLDEVVTAKGHTGRVLQTMVRYTDEGLRKVVLRGHNAFRSTPEHPVLTKRGYVPARDLRVGDQVALTRYQPPSNEVIHVSELVDTSGLRGVLEGRVNAGQVISEVAPLPSMIGMTPDLGRLLGLYAAEGHTTANKVVWSFGGHEEETLVEDTMVLIKNLFEAVPRKQVRPNGAINVVLYGKTWRLLFERLIPGTSKHGDKRLSPEVTAGPRAFLKGVWEGWLEGDGHRRRNCVEGVTVSHHLAMDMYAIAQMLGLRPTLNVSEPSENAHAKTRQKRWSVTVAEGKGTNVQGVLKKRVVWRKVSYLASEPFEGFVYNFHVEGEESYVAEGVGVHNCVGFGCTHELACRPAVVQGLSNDFARTQVYWEAQKIDEWPGGAYPEASPRYEGTSVNAGLKILRRMGYIDEYRWALELSEAVAYLGYRGPIVIGVDWYSGMFGTDDKGYIHATGNIGGGHCVLIMGQKIVWKNRNDPKTWDNVDMLRSYWIVHNSWGKDWGVEGRAKIALIDVMKLWPSGDFACITGRRIKPVGGNV